MFLMASVILDFSRSLSNRFIVAAQAVPSCGMSLTAAMWNLAWDETSRLLTLQLPGALRAAQRRSSWHVCVSTSKFDVVYTQASTGKMWRHTANLSRANVALMTTSAEALADALFDLLVAEMHAVCGKQFVRSADIGIVHWCRDAAAPNTRLIAAMQQE